MFLPDEAAVFRPAVGETQEMHRMAWKAQAMNKHRSVTVFVLFCVTSVGSQGYGTEEGIARAEARRPTTVADSIQMVQLAEPSNAALYSPDGTKFLTVLRRGNLEENTNEYSLLLWQTDELFHSPAPKVLLTISSSSNRAAIENPRWLGDDETIAFLGEHPDELHQLYTLDIRTSALRKVTNQPTNLTWFSMTANGDAVAFTAEAADESFFDENARKKGFLISTEPLVDLIRDRKERELYCEELFFQRKDESARMLKTIGALKSESYYGPPTLSPDGKYIVLTTHLHEVAHFWTEYGDPNVRQMAMEKLRPGQYSWLYTYELVDTRTGQSRVLVNAPIGIFGTEVVWSHDSDAVVISDSYLPLENTDADERKKRQSHTYVVEVRIPTGEIRKISQENIRLVGWVANTNYLEFEEVDAYRGRKSGAPSLFFKKTGDKWERDVSEIARVNPDILLEQGMNMPPRICASNPKTHQKTMLLDLNPQFKNLNFSRVEEIRWKGSDGHEVSGGLYYPLNFEAGKRYPLVIQTHGWTSQEFLMDGIFPAPFAAQALAAKDIAVLQADESFDNQNTPEEVKREVGTFEGAVDYLDQKELIDRNRVGIIGFSRTCLFVKYLLTHSRYQFAAASLEDGIDAGYWQYLVAGTSVPDAWPSDEGINGGVPFGRGLRSWLERSPSFSIENVRAPVRIVSANPDSLLYQWEWFAALTRLGKPVEMVYMRDGEHILQRPWDRMAAQQGNVDWFCFWLKGAEDPDPAKAEQYKRWHKLQKVTK
jgi:dipeptidyl aminopeptidase/acylaminoacyl peptidase